MSLQTLAFCGDEDDSACASGSVYGSRGVFQYFHRLDISWVEEINICDPPKAAVVIEYSKDKAVLYCYDNNCGNLATFVKQEGQWVIEAIDTRWARRGNANERVWPYILHPTFGWLFGESWPRGNLS